MAKLSYMCPDDSVKTTSGLRPNVAAALSYVLGWLSGLLFLVLEWRNEFVRYHAIQSIIVFGSLTVVGVLLGLLPVAGWILNVVIGFVAFGFWIVLMLRAYLQCSRLGPGCCYA